MQSQTTPVFVNWIEKFNSSESLISQTGGKETKNEKRLLFYFSEMAANTAEFMTDEQIENELFSLIYPLIGQYMCLVHENYGNTLTYSNLIFESLLRCLNQCLKKLGRESEFTNIKFNCFIDYLKDVLESQKSSAGQETVSL